MDINSVNSDDLRSRNLIFIDLETTGFSPQKHEILEIGAVKVEHKNPFNIIEEFCFKTKPAKLELADRGALKVVKFNETEWKEALDLPEVLKRLEIFGKEGIMVGYNVSFDWAFLDRSYFNLGKSDPFYYHRLDVMAMVYKSLYKAKKIRRYSLGEVCKYFEIKREVEHRALDDARATYEVFKRLFKLS